MKRSSRMLLRLIATACLMVPVIAWGIVINEIRIDQPGADVDEYFELAGNPGESLNDLSYLVIGDGAGGSGVIEAAIDLNGLTIPADGFFLAAESTFSLGGSIDLTTSLNFENSDNVTHLLVSNFTGSTGSDLDTNEDGLLDSTPWNQIVDIVALLETVGSGDLIYSTTTVGPDNLTVPGLVLRAPDVTGSWQIGQFDPAGGSGTPGIARAPEPVSIALLGIGLAALGLIRLRQRNAGTVAAAGLV